jgi:hypothetical protein
LQASEEDNIKEEEMDNENVFFVLFFIVGVVAGLYVGISIISPHNIMDEHGIISEQQCDPCHNDWRVGVK